jgi:hypothetical protein
VNAAGQQAAECYYGENQPWRSIHRAAAGLQPAVCEGPERRTEVHLGTLTRNVIYLRTKAKRDDGKRRN